MHVSKTGFNLHFQVEPTQLGAINRASPYVCTYKGRGGGIKIQPLHHDLQSSSPYLQTPAPTQRAYKGGHKICCKETD
jgi:hypothetical protein